MGLNGTSGQGLGVSEISGEGAGLNEIIRESRVARGRRQRGSGENKAFLHNSFLTVARQLSGIAIGFATAVVTARYLGTDGQGIFSLAILLPTMLMLFLNFGIEVSTVYYIGRKEESLGTIYKTNVMAALVLSVVSLLVGTVIIWLASEAFFGATPISLLFLCLSMLPVLFLNIFLQSIFQGKQDFKRLTGVIFLSQSLTLLLMCLLVIVLDLGIMGALISTVSGHVTTLLITWYLLRSSYGLRLKGSHISVAYLKKSMVYGIQNHLSNIATFLNYRADLMMIALFVNSAAVGIYAISVSVAEQLWFLSRAVSMVLFPKISSLNSEDERNRLTSVVGRCVLALSIVGGLIFYFMSGWFINLMFGADYAVGALALQLLLPGIILGSLERIIANDLSGRGKPGIVMKVSFITVSCNLLLNLLLVPRFGMIGASIATSTTYTISSIIYVVIFKRLTGVAYLNFIILQPDDWKLLAGYFRRKVRAVG
ncbi:flippase [Paenibacillus sp. S3N08]|uniref:Flippase n=1 Tax=Paenibacillus agricola TaxID=2716264 RepID=A0ABX0J3F6_9BACL|nr:flippase [Paenibacillus agricola]